VSATAPSGARSEAGRGQDRDGRAALILSAIWDEAITFPCPHAVHVMPTSWGELRAPGAVKVTVPLSRMVLMVAVWWAPAPSRPLLGVMV
jgi:hypothetical protein